MKALRIFKAPHPILAQPCAPVASVTPALRSFALHMLYTMRRADGIGLAAPQVGKLLRVFVVDIEWVRPKSAPKGLVFFNPSLELGRGASYAVEGCLSFPGAQVEVERAPSVRVTALGLDGKEFALDAEGLLARAIQHEADHLDGKTIT